MTEKEKLKSIAGWEAFAVRCAEKPVELPAPKMTLAKKLKPKGKK